MGKVKERGEKNVATGGGGQGRNGPAQRAQPYLKKGRGSTGGLGLEVW
jgi:hypothetical protein